MDKVIEDGGFVVSFFHLSIAPASAANPGGHAQTALSNAPGHHGLPSLVSGIRVSIKR